MMKINIYYENMKRSAGNISTDQYLHIAHHLLEGLNNGKTIDCLIEEFERIFDYGGLDKTTFYGVLDSIIEIHSKSISVTKDGFEVTDNGREWLKDIEREFNRPYFDFEGGI